MYATLQTVATVKTPKKAIKEKSETKKKEHIRYLFKAFLNHHDVIIASTIAFISPDIIMTLLWTNDA